MNPTFHDITPPKIDTEPDVFDDFGNFWKDDVPKFQVVYSQVPCHESWFVQRSFLFFSIGGLQFPFRPGISGVGGGGLLPSHQLWFKLQTPSSCHLPAFNSKQPFFLMDGNGETPIFHVNIWNHPTETRH